jgi:ribosomal-protein-alanine N-acetyltransferase
MAKPDLVTEHHLIRPATLKDLAAIAWVERQAKASPWTTQALKACLTGRYWCTVLTSLQQNTLGFYIAQYAAQQAELFNLCLLPKQQSKGLGYQLLTHFLTQAQQAGAQQIFLEVRCSNQKAIQLYQKAGFQWQGTRKGYYPAADGQREDALLMIFQH